GGVFIASIERVACAARQSNRWTMQDGDRSEIPTPTGRKTRRSASRPASALALGALGMLGQDEPGLDHRVRVERNALDFLLDQPLSEIGVIRRPLPADPGVLARLAASSDCHSEHRLHRIVALVETRRDGATRVAIDRERELREIVGADREAVE